MTGGSLSRLRRLVWRARPPVLALGGGGARGFAHIGVLQVLEEEGLPMRMLVGTSMGSVVGGMYLALGSAGEVLARWREALDQGIIPSVDSARRLPESETHEHPLLQMARRIRDRVVLSMAVNRRAMLGDKELTRAFDFLVPDVDVGDLRRPFVAVATDLSTGEEVRLRSGSLRRVVTASSSIPGLLPPVELEGRPLVDGGVLAEVPVNAAVECGRPVIAVDVSMDLPLLDDHGLALDTLMRTQLMTSRLLRAHQLSVVAHVIRPDVGHATWADWGRFEELVAAGRLAARTWLDRNRLASTFPRLFGTRRGSR